MSGFSHILDPIIHPLQGVLIALTGVLHNYGLAIIVFTILVRAVLSPLNIKQLKSARKMASLGPLQKELQQRYKGDRAALQQATMELYKEQGVNPAAGCLPLLVQMPVLYSLIFVFNNIRNFQHAAIYHTNFLWFSLDKPDSLFGHFFIGGFWGPLPVLAAATQWVQQRTSDPQQRSTQQIMQFMPLMIMLFAVRYPSGLALYWVTSTVFSIVMQYFITGFGQLFKSPFKVPHAVASPSPSPALSASARGKAAQSAAGPRAITTRANGAKANGNGANGAKANGNGANGAKANGNGANGAKANGNGRRATIFTASPPRGMAEDAELTSAEQLTLEEDKTRQGKMQRTVARQKGQPPKRVRRPQ